MEKPYVETSTSYWTAFAKFNFIIAVASVVISIIILDSPLVTKGLFSLASLYLFTTTVVLSKSVRDQAEEKKIINKIEQAKANKILKDYED